MANTKTVKKEFFVGDEIPDNTTLVKVASITEVPTDDPEYLVERGGYEFTYPLRIRIIDKDKNVVADDVSSATLRPREWDRKFYAKQSGNYTNVNFTRNENLCAIFKIWATQNGDDGGKFNVYDLEGFKFEAVLAGGSSQQFIDWVRTFKFHGIEVPNLQAPAPSYRDQNGRIDPKKLDEVDNTKVVEDVFSDDDLPF